MNPAIVIIAYNRPNSLTRLLGSISKSNYNCNNISLIISIDFENSIRNRQVKRIADSFKWKYGNKIIIEHKKNIGLRNHILECGNLTEEYGSIIMLEDDLYVSPGFYFYSKTALEFYKDDVRISGISLYNHSINFLCSLPFYPFIDQYDNYFLQIASSWGQAWTYSQWKKFKNWYNSSKPNWLMTPEKIKNWPETSWLKYFINYMITSNTFFVYPRVSFTTNFSDCGTHQSLPSPQWQVQLVYSKKNMNLSTLDQSFAVYDSFFELLPEKLKKINPQLSNFDFDVDLYALKKLKQLKGKYAITSKKSFNAVKRFTINLKPLELNLLEEREKGELVLAEKRTLKDSYIMKVENDRIFSYFYGPFNFRKLINILWSRIKLRFKINGFVQ